MTQKVAILGCGPAGLMVAHAARLKRWDFVIYSRKSKSPIFGAQYLHESIPDLTCGEGYMLNYRLSGTPEEYRHKVYGPKWDGNTSPEDYGGRHLAWDLRSAYDDLWHNYESEIRDVDLRSFGAIDTHLKITGIDTVISTVPRTVWDPDPRNYRSSPIWALGDSEHQRVHLYRPDEFTVQCDGTDEHEWYRVSNIFGYCTMEWPYWKDKIKPARGASLVQKPLLYKGNSASDFTHLGRYAQWEKGILTSDVFNRAMDIFSLNKIEQWSPQNG